MPPDETNTAREGALAARRSASSAVRRNGPATFVAKVSSNPSAVSVRSDGSTPTLWTSTSSRRSFAVNRSANVRTAPRSERSHSSTATRASGTASRTAAAATSPRSALRTSSRVSVPSRAKPTAAAKPMPAVAPMTIATFPAIDGGISQPRAQAVAHGGVPGQDGAVEQRVEHVHGLRPRRGLRFAGAPATRRGRPDRPGRGEDRRGPRGGAAPLSASVRCAP